MNIRSNETKSRLDLIRSFRFGVEVETVGLHREGCARAIQAVVGGEVQYEGGYYDKWVCVAPDGRKWTAMSDGSLTQGLPSAEVVTPILTYSDLETLQAVLRSLRGRGARADESCGIHVHVDASSLDAGAVTNLSRVVLSRETTIQRALAILPSRLTYCGSTRREFAERISRSKPADLEALARAWYGSASRAQYARTEHYNHTRYAGLNLHSVFFRGTVEFRWFNGTTHAGKVKAYVQFCLGLVAHAKASRSASAAAPKSTQVKSEADHFDDFLCYVLKLRGEEFATCRKHMTAHLPGGTPVEAAQEA